MQNIRDIAPPSMQPSADYFDRKYVLGGGGRAMFPPELWNVRGVTMDLGHRANSISDSWGYAFLSLVGHVGQRVWGL